MKTRYVVAAAVAATLATVGFTPSSAHAASKSVGRNNFYGTCDAQAHVSDDTTPGKVEVFGGWGCQVGKYFSGTLVCIIYVNGVEKMRTSTDITTATTKDCAVTYLDNRSSDSYYGKMIVKGVGGTNFTLKTGAIKT
jgi:hypothetical protein